MFQTFTELYKPTQPLVKPTAALLEQYRQTLPESLLDFWQEYGFGNYGKGILKLINPDDYRSNLYAWLGNEDPTRVPIMLTGFGDIIYYRKLSETVDDVCILDVHYRNTAVLSYSFDDFITDVILDQETLEKMLRKDLFSQALAKFGELEAKDVFFFVPALCIGGRETIEHVGSGSATVHQHILFNFMQ